MRRSTVCEINTILVLVRYILLVVLEKEQVWSMSVKALKIYKLWKIPEKWNILTLNLQSTLRLTEVIQYKTKNTTVYNGT